MYVTFFIQTSTVTPAYGMHIGEDDILLFQCSRRHSSDYDILIKNILWKQ